MGALIDWGITIKVQSLWMTAYALTTSVAFVFIARKISTEYRVAEKSDRLL